ncbi:MAG: vitamin K epoxide reductase family protein [Scytolyngbya sp. HA4215-MV1]|jgi:uncharacterized membrane protein/glutaredoxin|nr:vitamin K epoxide reductase family protein [Scytolyngbya sp. HA4215-MV1]
MSKNLASRRRSAPWIQRWSRVLIGAVAILGAINTAYITITKFTGNETACPTGGCEQVLSSPYASVFGLPLALYGLLAYAAMAAFALIPLAVNPEEKKQFRTDLENKTWFLLFVGSTAMLLFSGYLMYIMASKFVAVNGLKALCYYCVASAIFATTLFVLTLIGRAWEDVGQLIFTGIVVSMVTLVGTLGIYAGVDSTGTVQGGSGSAEVSLATYLRQSGVRMYGAYWCPHCAEQKELFGKQAFSKIEYIECDPNGEKSQAQRCQAAGIKSYPTWEINGKFYQGTQPLADLAKLAGYKGSMKFQKTP